MKIGLYLRNIYPKSGTIVSFLFFFFFRYYETSAGTGQGVHDMFSDVIAAAAEAKLVKAKPVINSEQSKHR